MKYVTQKKQSAEQAKREAEQKAADEKLFSMDALSTSSEAKDKAKKQQAHTNKEGRVNEILTKAKSLDGLLDSFSDALRDLLGVGGVYMGLQEQSGAVKYVAASENHKFMVDQLLDSSKGVTHSVFQELSSDDGDAENEDEEDGEKAQKKEPEDRTVFVPNVMMGPNAAKVHFFRLPQLGSYFAVRISYDAILNSQALEEADDKEKEAMEMVAQELQNKRGKKAEDEDADEEEKAEPAPNKEESAEERAAREAKEVSERKRLEEQRLLELLPKRAMNYVLCVDTLGQDRRLADEELAAIARYARQLREVLVSLDRRLFQEERGRRSALRDVNDNAMETNSSDMKQALEAIAEQLVSAGRPATEEDVRFRYQQGVVYGLRKLLAEFRTYNVFAGPQEVLVCLFFLLGYSKHDAVDREGRPEWSKMRARFGEELFQRMKDFDPRTSTGKKKSSPHTTIRALSRLLAGLKYDNIKQTNYPLSQLFHFVQDAIAVRRRARAERKAAQELARQEAEERARQEAEEKARRADAIRDDRLLEEEEEEDS